MKTIPLFDEFVKKVIKGPNTLVECIAAALFIDGFFVELFGWKWAYIFELIIGVIGIVSLFSNHPTGSKKYIGVLLSLVVILNSGIGITRMMNSAPEKKTVNGSTSYSSSSSHSSSSSNSSSSYGSSSNSSSSSYGSSYNSSNYVPSYYNYKPTVTAAPIRTTCYKCYGFGSGKCSDCKGEGRKYKTEYSINLGSGSIPYEVPYNCYLCSGTGKCIYCKGKGYTEH